MDFIIKITIIQKIQKTIAINDEMRYN